MICLSNSQDHDDVTLMCLSKSQDDSMTMCRSNSHESQDESMPMWVSNSHSYVYGYQAKILRRRKRFRWVVLEGLFITFSPNIALRSMKSDSKTTHRNLFRRLNIFAWGSMKNVHTSRVTEIFVSRNHTTHQMMIHAEVSVEPLTSHNMMIA
jgi:hypothetical protein